MRITEKKLRKLIRKIILNERGSASTRSTMKRKNPLSVHLDLLPPLDISGGEVRKVCSQVMKNIGFDNSFKNTMFKFVIKKSKNNIEKFIEIFNSAKISDETDLVDGFDFNYLRSTAKDDFPVILTTTKGDISGKFSSTIISRENIGDMSWAIHDIYHQFGEPDQSSGIPKKGYPILPHFLFPDSSLPESEVEDFINSHDRLKNLLRQTQNHFDLFSANKRVSNIQEVAKNIKQFFINKKFTLGVEEFDVYPSAWAYIAMNIDEFDAETIEYLRDGGLSDDSIKFFFIMFGYVNIWDDWLVSNKDKIFINLSPPTMVN